MCSKNSSPAIDSRIDGGKRTPRRSEIAPIVANYLCRQRLRKKKLAGDRSRGIVGCGLRGAMRFEIGGSDAFTEMVTVFHQNGETRRRRAAREIRAVDILSPT
jgi:hypothetical protein